MPTTQTVGGIILCGGGSRRMGRDKANLPIGNETMLQRVARLLGESARPIVVVAASEQTLPTLAEDVLVVRDKQPDRGPLVALSLGLGVLRGRVEIAYVTSCDAPFLQPGWVHRVTALMGDDDLAVPNVDGHFQTLTAAYRVTVKDVIDRLIASGRSDLKSLLSATLLRTITEEELRDVDPSFRSLVNINSPDDYARALAEVRSREG